MSEEAAAEAAQAETQTTTEADPWGSLAEDVRGFVANKGWKSPEDSIRAYQQLESFRGVPDDRLVKLPAEGESWDGVWQKLGRPDSPDAYSFALPEESMKDGVFTKIAAKAHEAGVTDAQFKELQGVFAEASQEVVQQRQQQFDAAFEAWKIEHKAEFQNVRALMGSVGADPEEMTAAINGDAAAFYGLLARVAEGMGEGQMETGRTPEFQMTPSQAGARLKALHADEGFMARLHSDDAEIRKQAAAERRHLFTIMNEGRAQDDDESQRIRSENAQLRAQIRGGVS